MCCSISGCILFKKNRSLDELKRIEAKVKQLIIQGEDRGRDSYGIVSFTSDGQVTVIKRPGRPSESLSKDEDRDQFITAETTIVINNDRAEPTTEHVSKKQLEDIQPVGTKIYVAHNGTIANDKDLEERYRLERRSRVDTAVIPPLLETFWNGSLENLQKILRDLVVGSYGLAIVDRKSPETLYLACNYKPLYLEYDKTCDVLFFTSLENYLQQQQKPIWNSNPVRQMKPYSLMMISTDRTSGELTLWKHDANIHTRQRALVVCSGGLDSTVAAKVLQNQGFEVTLLHFRYRHRAERREAERVKRIASRLGCNVKIVDTDIFRDVIGHSRLIESSDDQIIRDGDGEAGAEFAYEWVPARNLIFLSIAVGIAEAQGFGTVALGNNLEEAGAYPDNEMIFIEKLNDVLPYATNYQKRVKLAMPVGNLMKHEIVKLGVEIDAPLEETWSCYEGEKLHCGTCGPCYMRRKAFKINGLIDPVKYQSEETFNPVS
jgi:7-cyano-7-deazaguanine synthase